MAYFREAFDDDLPVSYDPVERLETARWLHWCGWEADAQSILRSIAMSIEDREPTSEEWSEFVKEYEEQRFAKEN